jgi:hypothetical protein
VASTSIKVEADTKRALDELQAVVAGELGRKVTLQELTAVLARLGQSETDRVIAAFVDRAPRRSPAEARRLVAKYAGSIEFPIRVAPEELDDLIYGFPHGHDRPATQAARRLHRRLKAAEGNARRARRAGKGK